MVRPLTLLILLLRGAEALAGPYALATGDAAHPIDPGVPGFVGPDGPGVVSINNELNPLFVAWASRVVEYRPADQVDAAWSDPQKALGPVTADHFDIVSLGELDGVAITNGQPAGRITLAFDLAIADGPGPDFAVFENGFDIAPREQFAELAYVEVSTDGHTFARFPSRSLTPQPVAFNPGTIDPTDVYNLAGKHANNDVATSFGTPFDLAQLAPAPPEIDLRNIRFVRLVDIPGNGDFTDTHSPPQPIFDVWPTEGSGGFDLEAIGVIHHRVDLAYDAGQGFDFFGATNRTYQLQQSVSLTPFQWQDLGLPIPGDNQAHQRPLPPLPPSGRAYYRLVVLP